MSRLMSPASLTGSACATRMLMVTQVSDTGNMGYDGVSPPNPYYPLTLFQDLGFIELIN
jgi:hypothetical protein